MLGYEPAENKKGGALFVFCGASRAGPRKKQKQKGGFVFVGKLRKDRPERTLAEQNKLNAIDIQPSDPISNERD